MIFGKTQEEKELKLQEKLKTLYLNENNVKFILIPKQLENGKWVWLQKARFTYNIKFIRGEYKVEENKLKKTYFI